MIQKTYCVDNDKEYDAMIADIKALPEYETARGRFLMMAMMNWDRVEIDRQVKRAASDLRDLKIIAFNNAGNQNEYIEKGLRRTEYSFFLFNGDCVDVLKYRIGMENDAEKLGKAMKADLAGYEDVRGVFVVASMGFFNVERALEELDQERRRYPFF